MIRKIVLSALVLLLAGTALQAQQEVHVSPNASKGGKGTLQAPYASIEEAKLAVRKLTRRMNSDITVYLHGGTYALTAPLFFTEEDSGQNGFRVIYKAYGNETPVISGGQAVTGWEPTMHRHIFSAPFNSPEKLRTLFVNGVRARMAGMEGPVTALGSWGQIAIEGTESWAFGSGSTVRGIKFRLSDLPVLSNPEDVELIQRNQWNEKILCASEIAKIDVDTVVVEFQQPLGAIMNSLAWSGRTRYDRDFIIRNAIELLDSPGEFYFDRKKQRIFYYTNGEDMTKVEVIAPVCEGLIRIQGSNTSSRVKNLAFEGITFSHDAWGLTEVEGSRGFGGIQNLAQAVKYIPDGNWHPTHYNSVIVAPGSIDVRNAENISFIRNRFIQLNAGSSLSYLNDVSGAQITGNFFHDLLGNAVTVGHPHHYEIGGPSDELDCFSPGEEGVCKNIRVTNNYIRNISLDFRMVEALLAYFVEDVHMDHNDVLGTPYGAIAMGWWWGNANTPPSTTAKNNSINYNRLGHSHIVLNDGGMIYTLGKQPGSEIIGNYLFEGPQAIYPDDGSAYWKIENNFVNSLNRHWLHIESDRCHDIDVGTNYTKQNMSINNGVNTEAKNTINYRNRPFGPEPLAIQAASGIQEEYKDIIPAEEPARIDIYPWVKKDSWIY